MCEVEENMSQNLEFQTGVIKPIECMKEGWEMIKDQYWMFFGITLVGMIIGGLIPFGIGIGAMFCGIYYCLFQKMNAQTVSFEGLFKGFNYFVPGLVATLIIVIPMVIFMVIIYGSMFAIMFSSMDKRGQISDSAIFTLYGTLIVESIIASLFFSCLHALIMFAFPLIVERNMSGFDALKLSARAVWKNLSGVIGLILAEFALGFVGYLVCAVGVYFTLPIMFAGVLVAYRKVFPLANSKIYNSPPMPPTSW